jgi:DNA polymerase III epsilon subunit-like protein
MSINPRVSVLDLEWVVSHQTQRLQESGIELIEIGIVNLDFVKDRGWKEVERYTTLFQYQEKIPKRIAELTGIEQSELLNAPSFYQTYELIELLTRGRTIVGHSVSTDYKHLQNEMHKYMTEYNRETFCTLESAKTQWPELNSYELSSLCHLHGKKNIESHRALSDALNCVEIFKKIAPSPSKKQEIKTPLHIDLKEYFPWLSNESNQTVLTAKECPAIFSLYSHKKLLWIGTTQNAKTHLSNQLVTLAKMTKNKKHPVTHLILNQEKNEISSLIKVEKIKLKFRPTWQRHRPAVYGIYEYKDRKDLLCLKVRRAERCKNDAFYYDLSKKRTIRVAEIWQSKMTEYHKLIYSQKEEQTKWIESINSKRKKELILFSKNKSISIKNESQEGSMQSFINPFKGIFNLLNKEVTHYKIDIAGYCELLDLIQKIKGRNKHPYSIKEYDHLFTLEYLQHFSQAETVDFASPRP